MPINPTLPDRIPGGSSSGSAIALACNLASFALEQIPPARRIPAAFNRPTGLPTRLLSTRGVVPACRSLDCVTLFTHNTADAALIASVTATFDSNDPSLVPPLRIMRLMFRQWQGPLKLAVIEPNQLAFFGDTTYADAYRKTVDRLEQTDVQLKP